MEEVEQHEEGAKASGVEIGVKKGGLDCEKLRAKVSKCNFRKSSPTVKRGRRARSCTEQLLLPPPRCCRLQPARLNAVKTLKHSSTLLLRFIDNRLERRAAARLLLSNLLTVHSKCALIGAAGVYS
jgi:hypothetical protein